MTIRLTQLTEHEQLSKKANLLVFDILFQAKMETMTQILVKHNIIYILLLLIANMEFALRRVEFKCRHHKLSLLP